MGGVLPLWGTRRAVLQSFSLQHRLCQNRMVTGDDSSVSFYSFIIYQTFFEIHLFQLVYGRHLRDFMVYCLKIRIKDDHMNQKTKCSVLCLGLLCLMFCGCSPIDIPDGVRIETASSNPVASDSAESLTQTAPELLDIESIPANFVPRKNAADPFSDITFALDPSENQAPRFGVIYANLPDDAIVKLWLRYEDASHSPQGQLLYRPVKKGIVKYLFDLPAETPSQTMILEVSLRTDDAEHVQPAEIITLFGRHGEYMMGQHAVERALGGQYLMKSWPLEWPEPSPSSAQCVYISETGAKYHGQSCRHYRASMLKVLPEIAAMRGYGACGVCDGRD